MAAIDARDIGSGLVLSLAVLAGCGHNGPRFNDAIVHTDRIGYSKAYALNETLVAAGGEVPTIAERLVPPDSAVVDLTYSFGVDTLYWPGEHGGFELEKLHVASPADGKYESSNGFKAPEHGGTHLDAPLHFAPGHASAADVPLSRLMAPAIVIDISEAAAANSDAELLPVHIEAWEGRNGPIGEGTIVLVRTGWGVRWPQRAAYYGGPGLAGSTELHFPGISAAAASALVERRVAAVGIDTASLDFGPSQEFPTHRILLGADIPGFENVARLEAVPERGSMVIALPMKITSGTGSPLRIVAIVPRHRMAALETR